VNQEHTAKPPVWFKWF